MASVSQTSMRGPEPQQTPFLPPNAPRLKRPYPGEEGPQETLRSATGLPFSGPPSLGPPSAGMGPLTTPPRSMSQPMVGHMQPGNPDRPQLPPMARDPHGRPTEFHGQPMLPPGQNYPPPQSPGVPVWSTPGAGTSLYQSLRSDVTKAEGGMVVRLPGDEGGILIPVDVHQASKQADEKRQRNAGASARFRQRKKERDQEQTASLQKLEQRGRDLEARVRELTRERDFLPGRAQPSSRCGSSNASQRHGEWTSEPNVVEKRRIYGGDQPHGASSDAASSVSGLRIERGVFSGTTDA
ncbi:uncharacterized protein N0V96_007632 [Colletotrichum fioriniae]|uniref:uncharacterized protein n=1 Tax=Colletotrichum fioriniae TaxID=710243 RepID=UPI0032DAFC69|nr:hypothetical protein N0V96_007632 [Colletotrichum fioriniae]